MKGKKVFLGVFIVLCLIVSVASVVVSSVIISGFKAEEDGLSSNVSSVEASNNEKSAEIVSAESKVVQDAVGYDAGRVASDKELIGKFLETVFKWDSWDSYNDAREGAMSEYKIDESVQFFSDYMTYIEKDAVNAKGVTIPNANPIDSRNLSMVLGTSDIYVVSMDSESSTIYNYIALCDAHTQESGVSTGQSLLVSFKLDSGGIVDVVALPVVIS